MLIGVLLAVLTLRQIPALRVTAWSLFDGLVDSVAGGHLRPADFYPAVDEADRNGASVPARILLTALLVAVSVWFFRRIPAFALWEEQAFRQGAEQWSVGERLLSAHIFGWAHFLNMVYPLATVCVLMVGGWLFTICYLAEYRRSRASETATYRATALHSVYNLFAGVLFVGGLLAVMWL